jgi:hypothetical protein
MHARHSGSEPIALHALLRAHSMPTPSPIPIPIPAHDQPTPLTAPPPFGDLSDGGTYTHSPRAGFAPTAPHAPFAGPAERGSSSRRSIGSAPVLGPELHTVEAATAALLACGCDGAGPTALGGADGQHDPPPFPLLPLMKDLARALPRFGLGEEEARRRCEVAAACLDVVVAGVLGTMEDEEVVERGLFLCRRVTWGVADKVRGHPSEARPHIVVNACVHVCMCAWGDSIVFNTHVCMHGMMWGCSRERRTIIPVRHAGHCCHSLQAPLLRLLDMIVTALSHHGASTDIVEHSLVCLTNMGNCPGNKGPLLAAVGPLLAAVGPHHANSTIMKHTLKCLHNIAIHASNAAPMGRLGVVAVLQAALAAFPTDAELVEAGTTCLSNIAGHPDNRVCVRVDIAWWCPVLLGFSPPHPASWSPSCCFVVVTLQALRIALPKRTAEGAGGRLRFGRAAYSCGGDLYRRHASACLCMACYSTRPTRPQLCGARGARSSTRPSG